MLNTSNTDILTATYGGAVGIRNNNLRTLHLNGTHTTTQFRMTLAASNGAGNGDIHMQMWVSEGGRTWDGGGIGMNVSNYSTVSYPEVSASSSDNNYFPRLNSNISQAYIRFLPNGGRIEFSTRENNGTSYEQIHMRYGCLGVNVVPSGSYKIQVSGDINVTGKYYVNGQEASDLLHKVILLEVLT